MSSWGSLVPTNKTLGRITCFVNLPFANLYTRYMCEVRGTKASIREGAIGESVGKQRTRVQARLKQTA